MPGYNLNYGWELNALLFDAGRFSNSVPKVEKTRAANIAAASDFQFVDTRAVYKKRALYTDPVCESANGHILIGTALVYFDHGALKDLYPLAIALDDLGMDPERIPRKNIRKIILQLLLPDGF
jgi:lipopolysaccharide biosynthesis protein